MRFRSGAVEPQLPDRRRPQGFHSGNGDDVAVAEDGDGVRGLLDFAQDMRAEEHGGAAVHGLADHGMEDLLDQGVKSAGGFVQDQELRLVHERLQEAQLLLVSLG
ncbi:hypothetical protein PJL18_01111 [Paenarthrobacter nicotinovorans]|nr:hypothetical protein [Paenarthrobacter nicotinovorans]